MSRIGPLRPGEIILSFSHLTEGRVVRRQSRFLVLAELNEQLLPVHLHDPGRLTELIRPGARILIRPSVGRKTSFSVTAAWDELWGVP